MVQNPISPYNQFNSHEICSSWNKNKSKGYKNTTETKMGEVTMGIAHLEKCYFGCHDETFLFFFPSILPMLVVREKTVAG